MKHRYRITFFTLLAVLAGGSAIFAQSDTSGKKFTQHVTLLFSTFGDFAYKTHADTVHGGRGISQYSGMQKNQSLFQFRRIYLGCSYQISPRFSSELLL